MYTLMFSIPLLLVSFALCGAEKQDQIPSQEMSCKRPRQGPTGPTGPAGLRGPTGPSGSGATGPTGPVSIIVAGSGLNEVPQVIPVTFPLGVTINMVQASNFGIPLVANNFIAPSNGVYVYTFTISGTINNSVSGLAVSGLAQFSVFVNGNSTQGIIPSPTNFDPAVITSEFTVTGSILLPALTGSLIELRCFVFNSGDPDGVLTIQNVYASVFQIQ